MAYHDSSRKTFVAGEGLDDYPMLVSFSAGAVIPCASNAAPFGVTSYPAEAGQPVGVRLLNDVGTMEILASGAIDAGEAVVPADGGKVRADPAVGTRTLVGLSLTAVTDGGVVEVIPYGFDHVVTSA